jgi:hypothetical protein
LISRIWAMLLVIVASKNLRASELERYDEDYGINCNEGNSIENSFRSYVPTESSHNQSETDRTELPDNQLCTSIEDSDLFQRLRDLGRIEQAENEISSECDQRCVSE